MGDKSPSGGATGMEGREKALPEPSFPELSVQYESSETKAAVAEIFGRVLSDVEIGMLVGGQEGGRITVSGDGNDIIISQEHEHMIDQERYLGKRNGVISIYNSLFILKDNAPDGFGTKVFTDQVRGASKLGVKQIAVSAAGYFGGSMNGYYTWPRMGYNGEIPPYTLNTIPGNIRKVMNGGTTMQDLYRTPEGRNWWRENGSSIGLVFDLSENSLSQRVLQAYNEERSRRPKN